MILHHEGSFAFNTTTGMARQYNWVTGGLLDEWLKWNRLLELESIREHKRESKTSDSILKWISDFFMFPIQRIPVPTLISVTGALWECKLINGEYKAHRRLHKHVPHPDRLRCSDKSGTLNWPWAWVTFRLSYMERTEYVAFKLQ
jgi:hypothetical protein